MKVLIIEDEQNAIDRLNRMIEQISPATQIVGTCTSLRETTEWLKKNELPDLILSDVQLTDGVSLDLFLNRQLKIPVIFVSAFDHFAIDAFKANGLHYLLKPVSAKELKEAIDRFLTNKKEIDISTAEKNTLEGFKSKFIAQFGTKLKVINAVEVAYFFSDNKITYLVTKQNEKYLIDSTLEKLVTTVNPSTFFRINRQLLISIESIESMKPASKQRIEITLKPSYKEAVFTSYERTPDFKDWLNLSLSK